MNPDHKGGAGGRADLESEAFRRVVAGLREDGAGYREIAARLSITAREVEAVLGEVAALRAAGCRVRDIAERVGSTRSVVQRLAAPEGGTRRRVATAAPRTTQAMTLLADSYGLQVDLLAIFLGTDRKRVYPLIRALQRDHLVMPLVQVQPGDKWVVPTGAGAASYLGWNPYTVWRPREKDAGHYRAVAQARLIVGATDREAWVSERQLRHEAAARVRRNRGHRGRSGDPLGGAHIHDGRFLGVVNGIYGWWALEVELTAKSARNMDIALQGAIRSARAAEPAPMVGLLYLCRGSDVRRGVDAARLRLPTELRNIDGFVFEIGDFDRHWTEFLDHYTTRREAEKRERMRNNPLRRLPAPTPSLDHHSAGGRTR
ncbi:hypothetical protein [Nocardia wallacei]|uniref:Uncharacterized protein n=1 Tax=Nocardia wallacei TaxID=480035 RepID=A0A7G1KFK4_9NOCA|nr:hypothetical protein [Nocardia wallacei]BCK53023.1 hypothetical protein NWFMUON74_07950 [Nocardia wallacei]